MSLQGDLATLELPDILQNLEMHRRSGTLVIESKRGTSRVYFKDGGISLCATDGRPGLVDALALAGVVAEKDLTDAKKPRWRRRRPIGEVLVRRKVLERDALNSFAQARLIENVCDFLALEKGTFHFEEGRIPGGVFDPEEKHLALSLPAGPILFESARRKDHLAAIRAKVGGDAMHYIADGRPDAESFEGDAQLAGQLCDLLDGARSVRELLCSFPDRRFATYETLAALVAASFLRPAGPEDLMRLAKQLVGEDPERALRVLRDGLEATPHHRGLLTELANLAEREGDKAGAADALKLLAHDQLEEDERDSARENLLRACSLAPGDTSILERCMELAQKEKRSDDAIAHGKALVELYRKPGMHVKAAGVLERLVELDGGSWPIRKELARTRTDCGNPTLAVSELRRFGKKLLARGNDPLAREVMQEILAIVPTHSGAIHTIKLIDSETFERRRTTRKLVMNRLSTSAIAIGLGLLLVFDIAARLTYSHATRTVAELDLIEQRRYADAIEMLESVQAEFPLTLTARLTLPGQLDALRQKHALRRPPERSVEPGR